MTDTTDITALREHNQHIVAHLTRSNPRRPLSSAEVLTLESAKLVVAALSVRDGLPDADHSEYWFEHEGKLLFDGALFNSRVEIFIESKLEAEHQRADDAHKYGCERDAENESLMLTVGRLRVELAELKGEQVPVAYLYMGDAMECKHVELAEDTDEGQAENCVPLFTAPQKPVVLDLNYFDEHFDRLLDEKDDDIEIGQLGARNYEALHIAIHQSIKAAIKAAGGIVKDGE